MDSTSSLHNLISNIHPPFFNSFPEQLPSPNQTIVKTNNEKSSRDSSSMITNLFIKTDGAKTVQKIWTFKIESKGKSPMKLPIEKKIQKRKNVKAGQNNNQHHNHNNNNNNNVNLGRCCSHCGTNNTPEWRRGPNGFVSLCNACGLLYRKGVQFDLTHEVPLKMAISRLLN